MHLLIPHASSLSDACPAALAGLALPKLTALLRELKPMPADEGDEWSLSPPHERVLARALGWSGADGCLPLAARCAEQDGIAPGDLSWGLLTPLHWHLGRDHLTVLPPDVLQLEEAESRALFEAAQPLFTDDGWLLHWAAPARWYVAHESLTDLPTASLDRVIGRNPDRWMPEHPQARWVKRLQNELQMLWYSHPVNDARQARGLPAVNSVWLWGCGRHQRAGGIAPAMHAGLREPLLAGDWQAWRQAWQTLDETALAELLAAARRGEPVTLTLAGERHARSWSAQSASWWARARAKFNSITPQAVLSTL